MSILTSKFNLGYHVLLTSIGISNSYDIYWALNIPLYMYVRGTMLLVPYHK